ncbi:unnamed protein product, partial [Allacma fusca]
SIEFKPKYYRNKTISESTDYDLRHQQFPKILWKLPQP